MSKLVKQHLLDSITFKPKVRISFDIFSDDLNNLNFLEEICEEIKSITNIRRKRGDSINVESKKFNVGQTVFYLFPSKIIETVVKSIVYEQNLENELYPIGYKLNVDDYRIFEPNELFESKEKLVKNLLY